VNAAGEPPVNGSVGTRLALLEARVRLITIALEGMIVVVVSALLAYFFKGQ
jgi:hypothetical protein